MALKDWKKNVYNFKDGEQTIQFIKEKKIIDIRPKRNNSGEYAGEYVYEELWDNGDKYIFISKSKALMFAKSYMNTH